MKNNSSNSGIRKDKALDHLAERINVAQFVAYEPHNGKPDQTYSRVRGDSPNRKYSDVRSAALKLLENSSEGTVNVRSYSPDDSQSKPFDYGLSQLDQIEQIVNQRISDGLHVILNETIDVSDGGVSGVLESGILEFSPDDTPRCVEKPGVASLPADLGIKMLEIVYGFRPDIEQDLGVRLEFSIHPQPRGWKNTHTLGWEISESHSNRISATMEWPNRFSRFLGDKAYGQLMAHLAGAPVPTSTVFHRKIKSFSFGDNTGSHDVWVRTCPIVQHPGLYATIHGWVDPEVLMDEEDPEKTEFQDPDTGDTRKDYIIASTIVQSGVKPEYSGSFNVNESGDTTIEGIKGSGDDFMLGIKAPEDLPDHVMQSITERFKSLKNTFGNIRFEWVYDGKQTWIVQLHRGAVGGEGNEIVPGDAKNWISYNASDGLESLRSLLESFKPGDGLAIKGRFGQTSHIADVIRHAKFPAKASAD